VDVPSSSYRWVVAWVSAVVNLLAWSVRSTFALFYVALLAEFGWRRGDAAIGYSLTWLLLVVFSPLAGWLYDRWGARVIVPIGAALLGGGLALTGRITTLWQYYLVFGVLGAAGIACIQMPAFASVSHWFVRSRGAAMGLVSAGASASAVVFYPVNAWLIVTLGWRDAFAVYGLVVAVIAIPVAAVLYRDAPATSATRETAVAPAEEWTLGAAMRSVPFWAVFVMWGLGVIGYQIVTTHQVAHAVGAGFEAVTLGWVFGFAGACTVAGNLVGGALSDRWGRGPVFALGSLIGIAGIAALAWTDDRGDLPWLLVYAASGFGFGMRIALLSAIPADIFTGRQLGVILGATQAGGGVGGFIGPFVGGWLFDVSGSYAIAFTTAAVSIALAAVAAWIAAARGSRRRAG
jgi:MFS family permease